MRSGPKGAVIGRLRQYVGRCAVWGRDHGFARAHLRPDQGGRMGIQVKCGSTDTKTGKRCRNKAMIGYSRCQKHRGPWTPPQQKKTKKR